MTRPTEGPGTFFHFDVFTEFACHNRFLTLQPYTQLLLLYDYVEVSSTSSLWNRNLDINLSKQLLPFVRQS